MSNDKALSDLLFAAGRPNTIQETLAQALRQMCDQCGGVAAELLGTRAGQRSISPWLTHDPEGVLASRGLYESGHARCDVVLPLSVGSREVGHLVVWFDRDRAVEDVRERAQPLDTVIALMVTGLTHSFCANGLLDDFAFRARVVSEMTRADRFGEGLSLIHIDLVSRRTNESATASAGWKHAAFIGDSLLPKLRACDAIGLMGSNRLCVLLTGCSPLCASIAERRIAQFLDDVTEAAFGQADLEAISYPRHAANIEELLGGILDTVSVPASADADRGVV